MPDEKFECCSFSILGDITSQAFPVKKGMSHRIWIFTSRNGFNFKTMRFDLQNRSFRSEIDPPPPLCQCEPFFKQRNFYNLQNFIDVSVIKEE